MGIFILGIALASAGLGVVFLSNNKGDVKNQKPALSFAQNNSQIAQQEASKDSDGDNLKNWEEALWKTDPLAPDTDSDGTNDNDEILAKRDPTLAGPGDELTDGAIETIINNNNDNAEEETNLTESLAADFAAMYLRQKFLSANGGNPIDESYFADTLLASITETISNKASGAIIEEHFSSEDFVVTQSSSPADVRRYFNSLGALLEKNKSPATYELEIVNKAIKEENYAALEQLSAHRDAYRALANKLLELPTPKTMLETHRELANNLWRLSLLIEDIMRFENDPIKGIATLNAYVVETERSLEALRHIVEAIKTNGFNFAQNEGGALFNKYLDI